MAQVKDGWKVTSTKLEETHKSHVIIYQVMGDELILNEEYFIAHMPHQDPVDLVAELSPYAFERPA